MFADGVGSTARAMLLPDVRPRTRVTSRGAGWCPRPTLSTATRAALGDAITYYVYANSHILVYPIPGSRRFGRRRASG